MAQEIKFPRINSIMISGHLTREVELRHTPKGSPVARFNLAFNRNYLGSDGNWVEEVSFINVKTFGKNAETSVEKLHKGSPVIVEGYISSYSYTDKEQNQKTIYEINASKIHYLEKTQSDDRATDQPTFDTDQDVPF